MVKSRCLPVTLWLTQSPIPPVFVSSTDLVGGSFFSSRHAHDFADNYMAPIVVLKPGLLESGLSWSCSTESVTVMLPYKA